MEREILDRGEVGRWAGGSPFLGYFDSPERRKLAVARGDSVRPPLLVAQSEVSTSSGEIEIVVKQLAGLNA